MLCSLAGRTAQGNGFHRRAAAALFRRGRNSRPERCSPRRPFLERVGQKKGRPIMQAAGVALNDTVTVILIEHPAGGWFFYSWDRCDGKPLWMQPTLHEREMRFTSPEEATD